jgi:hypothetical protein
MENVSDRLNDLEQKRFSTDVQEYIFAKTEELKLVIDQLRRKYGIT